MPRKRETDGRNRKALQSLPELSQLLESRVDENGKPDHSGKESFEKLATKCDSGYLGFLFTCLFVENVTIGNIPGEQELKRFDVSKEEEKEYNKKLIPQGPPKKVSVPKIVVRTRPLDEWDSAVIGVDGYDPRGMASEAKELALKLRSLGRAVIIPQLAKEGVIGPYQLFSYEGQLWDLCRVLSKIQEVVPAFKLWKQCDEEYAARHFIPSLKKLDPEEGKHEKRQCHPLARKIAGPKMRPNRKELLTLLYQHIYECWKGRFRDDLVSSVLGMEEAAVQKERERLGLKLKRRKQQLLSAHESSRT